VISGCAENRLINRESNVTVNGGLNFGSAIEMTFRNGKLKVWKTNTTWWDRLSVRTEASLFKRVSVDFALDLCLREDKQ
jgi:hypothetical protein